jgi:hypothetical protein
MGITGNGRLPLALVGGIQIPLLVNFSPSASKALKLSTDSEEK